MQAAAAVPCARSASSEQESDEKGHPCVAAGAATGACRPARDRCAIAPSAGWQSSPTMTKQPTTSHASFALNNTEFEGVVVPRLMPRHAATEMRNTADVHGSVRVMQRGIE
eukprot:1460375-Prymnesium_polylepis.1